MSTINSNAERAVLFERRPLTSTAGLGAVTEAQPEEADAPKASVLGKTLSFRGELTAEEDLILQGRVEGSIRHGRNLTIGCDGSVQGNVYASHLTIEGLVEGDVHATEAVIVRATAQVHGNILAPRVGLVEGATFNGRVEMNSGASATRAAQPADARPATSSAPARPAASPRPATKVDAGASVQVAAAQKSTAPSDAGTLSQTSSVK